MAEVEDSEGGFHGAQGHLCGIKGGLLDGGGAEGAVFLGFLGHGEGLHDAVEGLCVFIYEMQQLAHQCLPLVGPSGELLPTVVPSGFVAGEVGHHRGEGGSQCAHIGGNGSSAGGWALPRCFLGKGFHAEFHEGFVGGGFFVKHVFYYFLLGMEGLEVVEPHGLDGDVDDVALGNAGGTLLLLQEVPSGIQQGFLGYQSHDFGTGDAKATGLGTTADFIEGYMKGCH